MQSTLKKKPVGDGGGGRVQKGSMVLARYHVDKAVYRARVEELVDDMVSVRFIDYGNKSENLASSDVYSWDTLMDMIPPQAVTCTLFGTTFDSYTDDQVEVFRSLMIKSSPMKMFVHKSFTNKDAGPEIVVTLMSKDRSNLLTKLSFNSCFKGEGEGDSEEGVTRLLQRAVEYVDHCAGYRGKDRVQGNVFLSNRAAGILVGNKGGESLASKMEEEHGVVISVMKNTPKGQWQPVIIKGELLKSPCILDRPSKDANFDLLFRNAWRCSSL